MINPLQSPPQIDIKTKEDELELDDLEFEPDMERKIRDKVKIKHVKNKSIELLLGSLQEGVRLALLPHKHH